MRIGITQRVEVVPHTGERRDCLDQRWASLMDALGYVVVPLANTVSNVTDYLDSLNLNGMIISGGNNLSSAPGADGVALEREAFETAALCWAESRGVPVFGVCHGLQMMNQHLVGKLSKIDGHVAVRHPLVVKDDSFTAFKELTVNSYHDYGILTDDVADGLEICAMSDDGVVEAACHEHLPWLGVMWHPERECPFCDADLRMLKGFFGDSETQSEVR